LSLGVNYFHLVFSELAGPEFAFIFCIFAKP
jgi:hypothetical protein